MIDTLSRDNPRLLQLEADYAALNLFPGSRWDEFQRGIDLQNFRGECFYLAQLAFGMTPERYCNTYDYAVSLGEKDTLVSLGEDSAFGCVTFEQDGVTFSRDLLDSVFELRFLRETLGVTPETPLICLDIGGGYGRFAHRFMQMFPWGRIAVIDGVPLSSYLCDFYLNYRKVTPYADMIPLGRYHFEDTDLAINQYSFSELPLSAVDFWLKTCAESNINWFFLVPHAGDLVNAHFVTTEPNGGHLDYYPLFAHYGYSEMRRVRKFPLELSDSLIYNTEYLMMERK